MLSTRFLSRRNKKKTDYITKEVVNSFFTYLEKILLNKKKQSIRLDIVGGEVFLRNHKATSFIRYLMKFSNSYDFELSFVTNGYHVDAFLDELKKGKHITYNITVDGIKEVHNSRRFLANGRQF